MFVVCDSCGDSGHNQQLCTTKRKVEVEVPQWKVNEFNYDFEFQYDEEELSYYGFALVNMKTPISLPSRSQLLMNPNIMIADTGSSDN
mmetsp:Transcript_16953/g.18309  ORF Transcript_16953/g.18309 Transcript_16953/m.18309 type:complete len:88 (-) Transcript_16953:638-901(-)